MVGEDSLQVTVVVDMVVGVAIVEVVVVVVAAVVDLLGLASHDTLNSEVCVFLL